MQRLDEVAQLRLVQVVHFPLEREGIAVGDRRADLRQEGRTDCAVLAVDVGVVLVGGPGAGRLSVMAFHQRLQPTGIRKGCENLI